MKKYTVHIVELMPYNNELHIDTETHAVVVSYQDHLSTILDLQTQLTAALKKIEADPNDRKNFAAMAMQGMCADPERNGSHSVFASDAVKFADALILELEKPRAT